MTDESSQHAPASFLDGYHSVPFEYNERPAPNVVHGAGSRSHKSTQMLTRRAAEVREQLDLEYPGIADLSLPTVELYCNARARALMLNEYVMGFVDGTRTRKFKGRTYSGVEGVPAYIWGELTRAENSAAKMAQDLGLDLTGRAKVMKDAAMSRHFGGNKVADLAAEGRRLRELRKAN